MTQVTFGPCGVLYIEFRDLEVARTLELIKDTLFVDLDQDDNVLGIECLLEDPQDALAARQALEAHAAGKTIFWEQAKAELLNELDLIMRR